MNRRTQLIEAMQQLANQGKDCSQCSGVCCTFVANSMQTTALETWEIYLYLRQQNLLNDTTRARLQQTVQRYRLDVPPPGDGARQFVRRTYTCPFFMNGPLGCSLPAEVKPYGCLGFNPLRAGVTEGGDCTSDQDLLAAREEAYAEHEAQQNHLLQQHFHLDWQKRPMPWALLCMWDAVEEFGEVNL